MRTVKVCTGHMYISYPLQISVFTIMEQDSKAKKINFIYTELYYKFTIRM